MRLTKMSCDACGRKPTFGEWFKGEITAAGYPEWRHPGITFKEAGIPLVMEKRHLWKAAWEHLFGNTPPDDLGFLCPECQSRIDLELPDLLPSLEIEVESQKAQDETLIEKRREEERSYFGQ